MGQHPSGNDSYQPVTEATLETMQELTSMSPAKEVEEEGRASLMRAMKRRQPVDGTCVSHVLVQIKSCLSISRALKRN